MVRSFEKMTIRIPITLSRSVHESSKRININKLIRIRTVAIGPISANKTLKKDVDPKSDPLYIHECHP